MDFKFTEERDKNENMTLDNIEKEKELIDIKDTLFENFCKLL